MNLVALRHGFISATPKDLKNSQALQYLPCPCLVDLVSAHGDRDPRISN